MPLSDQLLKEGNPALPDRGAIPYLGTPTQDFNNPTYPIIPFDGLEGTGASSPSTGGPSLEEWLAPSKTPLPIASSSFVGADELAANQRYKNYEPGVDNEEIAAQGQSSWDRWGNSALKFGMTSLGTFAQGLMTLPDTITAIKNRNFSDLYQSGIENGIDKWLKNLEDDFPNYYSAWEKEHPFLSAVPFSGGAANFWGDKVLKNLGFTVGAIASAAVQDAAIGALTGGTGIAPAMGVQVGRASLFLNKLFTGADKVGDLLSVGQDLGKVGNQLLSARNLVRAAAGVKTGNALRYGMNLYGAARTEGGVEAREGYNTLKESLTNDFIKETGYAPSGIDAERIEQAATASANVRMGINMALLTVSDAIQFDNLLRPFKAAKRSVVNGIELKPLKTDLNTIAQVKPTTLTGRIGAGIKAKLPNILSEGVYEEGGQYAAQLGTFDYYKNKYDNSTKDGLVDVINSTVEGLAGQFGTQEGLESMFLGAITAGLSSGALNLVNKGKQNIETQAIIATLNGTSLTGGSGALAGQYASTAKTIEIKKKLDEAVTNNDLFSYKNAKHELFYEFINGATKAGRFDLRIDQLKMLKELDQNEFEKMWGMEFNDDNRRSASSYVDALINKANDIKSTADSINDTFVNPYADIALPKTPEELEKKMHHNIFENWKTELGHYASFDYDSNQRINSMTARAVKIAPRIPVSILQNVGGKKGLQSLSKIYEGTTVNLGATKELATTPIEKERVDKEIKFVTKLKDRIDEFLKTDGSGDFTPLFTDLLNYEANNRVAETIQAVPKDKVSELIEIAHDLNQLEERKKFASDAWDKLTNPAIVEKYFADAKAKNAKAAATVAPTVTAPVVVTPPPAPVVVDPNSVEARRKRTEGTIGKSADPADPKPHNAVVYDKNGGQIIIQQPTKAELEAAIKAFYDNEDDVAKKEAEEALKKLRELEEAQRLLEAGNGGVNTGTPNEPIPAGGKKRLLSQIAASTYTTKDTSPERLRETKFLNNFYEFPDDVQRNARVMTVTLNNEAALGLTGLTAYKMKGIADTTSPDNGFIAAVFVEEEKGGKLFFLDENGKRIGPVGQATDINSIVYSPLLSTRLQNGTEDIFVSKAGDATPEAYQNAWREARREILDLKGDQFQISGFNISRGIPIENDVAGEKESNPIVGTLIQEKDMDVQGIIQIPTSEVINENGKRIGVINTPSGESINMPLGRPVLVHGSTVQFLNNRSLTDTEVDKMYRIIKELATTGVKSTKWNQATEYLKGMLYWGSPKEAKDASPNQIWFAKGQLHIGPTTEFPFRTKDIIAKEADIKAALSNTFNNINNSKLGVDKFHIPFEEITTVHDDGTFETKKWKNYQHFLLSPRADAPLTTTVASKAQSGYNYTGKYIRLTNVNLKLNSVAPIQPTQGTNQNAGPVITTVDTTNQGNALLQQAGGYDLTGTQPNTFPSSKGQITFTATVDNSSGQNLPFLKITEDDVYNAVIADLDAREDAVGNPLFASTDEAKKALYGKIYAGVAKAIIAEQQAQASNAPATITAVPATQLTQAEIVAQAQAALSTAPKTRKKSNFSRVFGNIGDVEVENWDKAEAWMKINLPNVPLTRLKHLVRMTGDGYAWGVFEDAAIFVYENAEIGTTYHEAFEAVWGMFSTAKERTGMISEFRARKGSYVDRVTGANIPYASASEGQIKEALANEFRLYVNDRKLPPKNSNGISRILKYFVDLVATIRNFILGRKVNEFFRKIQGGYYKNTPVNQRNIHSEYSALPQWNERTSHEVIQAIAAKFVQKTFEDGVALVELEKPIDAKALYASVYADLKEEFTEIAPQEVNALIVANPTRALVHHTQKEQIAAVWNDIDTNWNTVVSATNQFLRTLGVVNKEKSEEDDGSNEEENINNDDKAGKGDYLSDVMVIDSKKNASTAIKLLFGTLIQTVSNAPATNIRSINSVQANLLEPPDARLSSIRQQQLVNSAQAFNHIMNNSHAVTTLSEMIDMLAELAKQRGDYVRLFTRLKGDTETGKIAYDALTPQDWNLLIKFFDVFAKQRPEALIQIIDEAGNTYTVNANFGDAVRNTVDEFISQVRMRAKSDDAIIKYNKTTKTYDIVESKIIKYPTRTPEQKIAFLNALGFKFDIPSYEALSTELQTSFNKAVNGLIGQLKAENAVFTFDGKTMGITGPLNSLAEVMVRANGDVSESTFYNTQREKVQASVQHNYPSLFIADFNNVKSLEDLYEKFPQLRDVWSSDSEILRLGGKYFESDGTRTSVQLRTGYIDGTQDKLGRAKQTAQLSLLGRRIQEINQNLEGRYYGLVPADSKTEWLISMGNFVEYEQMSQDGIWDTIRERMLSYLTTEILLAQSSKEREINRNLKGKSGELRFFKDILRPEHLAYIKTLIDEKHTREEIELYVNNNGDIKRSITDFIEDEVDKTQEFLTSFKALTLNEDESYTWKKLDSKFRNRVGLSDNLSEDQLFDVLLMRTVNYMVANIEMHKILFGDPAMINDPTKRIKSFWSGTHTPYHSETEFNTLHNVEMNKVGDVALKAGDPGYHEYKNHLKTSTIADVISDGEIFEENNEADAQAWMLDGAYREFMQKNGYNWDANQEIQFQYEMAWTRNYLNKNGEYPTYSAELKAADDAILAKGNPAVGEFGVIKPKGSGLTTETEYMNVYLDKDSVAPLFLRHITDNGKRNPNIAKMYRKMMASSTDYIIMQSGRKLGARALHSIYNADGSFNDAPFAEDTVVEIPFRNLGIQQETPSGNGRVTLGSQISKHSTADLLTNGVPNDFKGDNWTSLTEEEKLKASPIYTEISNNEQLLKDLAADGYDRVLKRLGIEERDGGFYTEDKEAVVKFLHDELTRRAIDQNTLAGISVNPNTGDFNIPLEATPRYTQIKNILYSIVDKEIGSPKVNGGSYIMQSSLMWEEGNRIPSKNGFKVSGVLKYYTKEEPWMEIMLPHWFNKQLRDAGFKGTDEELIKHLNDSGILDGIGFRIPTQKLSSADRIRVVKFLPKEMGKTVVVPAEIVTKTGGDFDVDKMFTYLKNVGLNAKGKIEAIEYKGNREATREYYGQEFDKILEQKIKNTAQFFEAIQTLNYGLDNDKLLERYAALLDKAVDETTEEKVFQRMQRFGDAKLQADLREAYMDRRYRQALENAYFTSLQNLLSIPERFERLMSPNSAKALKDMNKRLRKLTLSDEQLAQEAKKNNHSLMLSPSYMSQIRHYFNIGKSGLGIANIAQTNHSQNQHTTIFIDLNKLEDLSAEDQQFIGDGLIRIPHNRVTINGKEYATISAQKDQDGNYISDEISMYVDGFVDIAKDTFLIELGATPTTVPIYLLMVKLGISRDNVIMFMNQPIIREFIKELEYRGWSSLTNSSIYKQMSEQFGVENFKPLEGNLDFATFEDNIKKYYKDKQKFTETEKLQQLHILDEFMKYGVIASHLFSTIRGSNYDTANFNDSNLIDMKDIQTQQAREQNILSGLNGNEIVPAVDALLDNTFVGARKEYTDRVRNAISIAVPIKIDSPRIRSILSSIKAIFSQKGMFKSERTMLGIARKVEASFIDYVMQTKLGLNNSIEELLRVEETSVATELENLKVTLPKDSDLANNDILKELYAAPTARQGGPKNIKLRNKDNDAYTTDLYIGALRELRENPHTRSLYEKLMRAGVLQSGVRKTSFSYTHLIPVEDYARIFAPIMAKLETYSDLDEFVNNYHFFRNQWKDEEIVPTLLPRYFEKYGQFGIPEGYFDTEIQEFVAEQSAPIFTNVPKSIQYITGKKGRVTDFIAVSHTYNKSQLKYPVIKVEKNGVNPNTGYEYTNRDIAKMRAKGNDSYRDRALYAVVMDGDHPLTYTKKYFSKKYGKEVEEDITIYKMINALGDGDNAQEYYGSPRAWKRKDGTTFSTYASSFDNGMMKIDREFSDQEILDAFYGVKRNTLAPSSTPTIVKEEIEAENTESEIVDTPGKIVFEGITLSDAKRSGKKTKFNIVRGTGAEAKAEEEEGYKVNIPSYPELDLFVYKEVDGWRLADNNTGGQSIGAGYNTAKEAIKAGIERLNEVIGETNKSETKPNAPILKTIGVRTIEDVDKMIKDGEVKTKNC